MLLNEEKAEKIGIIAADQIEPRHAHREKEDYPRQIERLIKKLPLLCEDNVKKDHRARQHHADKPLRQQRHRAGEIEKQIILFFFLDVRGVERGEGEREEKRERHIRDIDRADREIEQRSRRHHPRDKAGDPPVNKGPEHPRRQRPRERAERRADTRGKFVLPEDMEAGGVHPIEKDGLFKIFYVVQHRRDVIAGFDHLARYLRVASLVGLHQRVRAERDYIQEDQRRGDGDKENIPF